MVKDSIPQLASLTTAEKLELVNELWDDVLDHVDEIPVQDWQKVELDRSYEEYRRSPETARPWSVVREQIRRSL